MSSALVVGAILVSGAGSEPGSARTPARCSTQVATADSPEMCSGTRSYAFQNFLNLEIFQW